MSVTTNQIRQDYQQFKDIHIFSDHIIQKAIDLATLRLSADRWGTLLDYGTELFVVHYLTLKERADRQARLGGLPGDVKGILTSRTVGPVSNSWDPSSIAYEGAGFWNQTTFGIEFYQLARGFGAGGVQL